MWDEAPITRFLFTQILHTHTGLLGLIVILFQMLLSHPLISGDPLLQQQMRPHIPLLLQQVRIFAFH